MSNRRSLIVPMVLIVVGSGWLLTALGVAPGINWVWTLGLASAGVLTIAVSGWDKVSAVVGPLFLTASCLSVARQAGRLSPDVEVPVLVITTGLLLLFARSPTVPAPRWLLAQGEVDSQREHITSKST